jgi:hypothetical protein
MKYTVEMKTGGTIYIPSFIKAGSGTQKLIEGYTDTQTHRLMGRIYEVHR